MSSLFDNFPLFVIFIATIKNFKAVVSILRLKFYFYKIINQKYQFKITNVFTRLTQQEQVKEKSELRLRPPVDESPTSLSCITTGCIMQTFNPLKSVSLFSIHHISFISKALIVNVKAIYGRHSMVKKYVPFCCLKMK